MPDKPEGNDQLVSEDRSNGDRVESVRGCPEPSHRFAVRVYYEDTDFSGVVYHANYLRFLERGRTEYLRAAGVEQAAMRDGTTGKPLAFAVRHMTIDFLASARMDDHLSIETRVVALGGASLSMKQAITRDGTTLVEATVRIALVSEGRPRRLASDLTARLRSVEPALRDGPPGIESSQDGR